MRLEQHCIAWNDLYIEILLFLYDVYMICHITEFLSGFIWCLIVLSIVWPLLHSHVCRNKILIRRMRHIWLCDTDSRRFEALVFVIYSNRFNDEIGSDVIVVFSVSCTNWNEEAQWRAYSSSLSLHWYIWTLVGHDRHERWHYNELFWNSYKKQIF